MIAYRAKVSAWVLHTFCDVLSLTGLAIFSLTAQVR
jgi:hypothetical protein